MNETTDLPQASCLGNVRDDPSSMLLNFPPKNKIINKRNPQYTNLYNHLVISKAFEIQYDKRHELFLLVLPNPTNLIWIS